MRHGRKPAHRIARDRGTANGSQLREAVHGEASANGHSAAVHVVGHVEGAAALLLECPGRGREDISYVIEIVGELEQQSQYQ